MGRELRRILECSEAKVALFRKVAEKQRAPHVSKEPDFPL
jgi:hypothetical protein